MEGSGGVFSSGIPGARGPEGRQVSTAHWIARKVLRPYA